MHEDDAERAVRSALAIRDWALEENAVDVRLAVNTGEALVSVDARADEGLVAGDVINTAARLQTAAPVNGILVGEKTYRATEGRIEYREREPVAAKGKQEPIPVLGGGVRAVALRRRRRPGALDSTGRSPARAGPAARRARTRARGARTAARHDRRCSRHGEEPARAGAVGSDRGRTGADPVAPGPFTSVWRGRELLGAGRNGQGRGRDPRERRRSGRGVEAPRDGRTRCAARERSSGCERCCIRSSESPTTLPAGTGAARRSRRGAASSRDLPRSARPFSSSRISTGPTTACSTSSIPLSTGPRTCRSLSSLRRVPSCSRAVLTGAVARRTPRRCRWRRCLKRRRPSSYTRFWSDRSSRQTCSRPSWPVPAEIRCMPRSSHGWSWNAVICTKAGTSICPIRFKVSSPRASTR